MGRPSHSRTLSVWTNGQRVGTWTFNRRGEHCLKYDSDWMGSPNGRPLSQSPPFTGDVALKGDRVRNFRRGIRRQRSDDKIVWRLDAID